MSIEPSSQMSRFSHRSTLPTQRWSLATRVDVTTTCGIRAVLPPKNSEATMCDGYACSVHAKQGREA